MDTGEMIGILGELRVDASLLGPDTLTSNFVSWRYKVELVLTRAFGQNHVLAAAFSDLGWAPTSYKIVEEGAVRAEYFDDAMRESLGILDAAQFELMLIGRAVDEAVDHGFDPELWAFVESDVALEAWGKVVSQGGIFTEDRIRTWAGRPAEEIGKSLMTAVFGPGGDYRLGVTEAERESWLLLAMGVSGALRNPGGHRIIDRPDHKIHAIGVLGACSVLLNELRYLHGNRFVAIDAIEVTDDEGSE